MAWTTLALRMSSAVARAPASGGVWQRLKERLCNRYRPERHYMRGPGPKWREKHGGERRLGQAA